MAPLPVCKPLLPRVETLLPYLKQIDEARYYSNGGPLSMQYEKRLADHFGVVPNEIVTSANGTLALGQILNALDVKKGTFCVMPSWTFMATPAAAMNAGLKPYFVDIDADTWAITPEHAKAVMAKEDVGVVIVVAPFGAQVNVGAWEAFQAETGIPVIIDAASGFDSYRAELGMKTKLPLMISTHATKVMGTGEGAIVVTWDAELAQRVRMEGNFGQRGSREALVPGINAKLSEYAAAIGLAALDNWPEKRENWTKLTQLFAQNIHALPGITCSPGYNQGWVSSYGVIEVASKDMAEKLRNALDAENIAHIAWWGTGCHTHTAYKHCPKVALTVTEDIASRSLGLPFWIDMSEQDVERIFNCVTEAVTSASVTTSKKVAKRAHG